MHNISASLIRGGTSKGLYFLKSDLPTNTATRDKLLLSAMGSPDARQIDGVGGAHPLTSKVAIVSVSEHPDADIDYLFLQVVVDKAIVSDGQNCGNILAGVGPFAIEQGLIGIAGDTTDVRIRMLNTGAFACARVKTPNGAVNYEGAASIDGVPGTAAPVMIDFLDVAGSSCGSLFPTGNPSDVINGVEITCIDNGMPVVIMNTRDMGVKGTETPSELESNTLLKSRVEAIRLAAGRLMNLGDVSQKTVPKMTLVSPATAGGTLNTRTFIPHRVHEAIGVLGSVSVATASMVSKTVAHKLVFNDQLPKTSTENTPVSINVEHPTGAFVVEMDVSETASLSTFTVNRAALLRTARMLMQGNVFVPSSALEAE